MNKPIIDIFIFLVCLLILVSKYLDCLTTSSNITNLNQEKNPIARKIMYRLGIKNTIWGIFVLTVIIVILSVLLLFNYYNTTFYKVAFVIIGLIVSIIQFAVAHTNKTYRLNFLTKYLIKFAYS